MTQERINEISYFLAYSILDELMAVLPIKEALLKELYNKAESCFHIQWYYDEEFGKVYLDYGLDPGSQYQYNYEDLYLRINSRLLNNFRREYHYDLCIVTKKGTDKQGPNYGCSQNYLRFATFSYWWCYDESYRFLEDSVRVAHDYYGLLMENPSLEEIHSQFRLKVLEINKKYDFTDNANVPLAFEEYATLYESFFGRKLKKVEQDQINYVFFDIFYYKRE